MSLPSQTVEQPQFETGYVMTCLCESQRFKVILASEDLDDARDIIGFICLECGESYSMGYAELHTLN